MHGQWTRRRFLSVAIGKSTVFMSTVLVAACSSGTTLAPTPTESSQTPSATKAATGPGQPTSGPAPAATAATTGSTVKTTITVWWGVGPQQKAVATDFEKANPGIHVELAELGQNVYGNPKYLAAVAAGTGPDVAYQTAIPSTSSPHRGCTRISPISIRQRVSRSLTSGQSSGRS